MCRGIGTSASLITSKTEFMVLISCYQVGYLREDCCLCIQQTLQEVEKKLHSWECEQTFFISQSRTMLSKGFFVCSFMKDMLPCGKREWLLGRRLLSAQATGPAGVDGKNFFLLPQVPSSVQYLCRLLCRRRWKEKRNILPIALLIPESLCFSFSPSSKGSFAQKYLAKQKRCCCFCMGNKSLIY